MCRSSKNWAGGPDPPPPLENSNLFNSHGKILENRLWELPMKTKLSFGTPPHTAPKNFLDPHIKYTSIHYNTITHMNNMVV